MTSPDPVPVPLGPVAAIVTTEGMTLSATEVTGQALVVDEDEDAEVAELTLEPDDCVAPTMMPPTTPPTTSALPSATHTSHRRGLRECLDSLTTALRFRPDGHDPHAGPPGELQQVAHGRASGADLEQAPLGKLHPRWRPKLTCPASLTSSPGHQARLPRPRR